MVAQKHYLLYELPAGCPCTLVFCLPVGDAQVCQLTEGDALGPFYLKNAPFRSTVCSRTPGDTSTPLSVEGYIKGNNCYGMISALVPPVVLVRKNWFAISIEWSSMTICWIFLFTFLKITDTT